MHVAIKMFYVFNDAVGHIKKEVFSISFKNGFLIMHMCILTGRFSVMHLGILGNMF